MSRQLCSACAEFEKTHELVRTEDIEISITKGRPLKESKGGLYRKRIRSP